MKPTLHFVKVFCSDAEHFEGNTSSVLFFKHFPADDQMQKIAADFNQPASTFIAESTTAGQYLIRWFAPDGEIGLCGHGTAAAIAYLKEHHKEEEVLLAYRSGVIKSLPAGPGKISFELDAEEITEEVHDNAMLEKGLGVKISKHFRTSNKNIVVVDSEQDVKNLKPDFSLLATLPDFGYIVTAPGIKSDMVCRTLVPKVRQLEDPATGSSHAVLTPYWADCLNKTKLISHQLSERGGLFYCEITVDNKVRLTGHYKNFAMGNMVK